MVAASPSLSLFLPSATCPAFSSLPRPSFILLTAWVSVRAEGGGGYHISFFASIQVSPELSQREREREMGGAAGRKKGERRGLFQPLPPACPSVQVTPLGTYRVSHEKCVATPSGQCSQFSSVPLRLLEIFFYCRHPVAWRVRSIFGRGEGEGGRKRGKKDRNGKEWMVEREKS